MKAIRTAHFFETDFKYSYISYNIICLNDVYDVIHEIWLFLEQKISSPALNILATWIFPDSQRPHTNTIRKNGLLKSNFSDKKPLKRMQWIVS